MDDPAAGPKAPEPNSRTSASEPESKGKAVEPAPPAPEAIVGDVLEIRERPSPSALPPPPQNKTPKGEKSSRFTLGMGSLAKVTGDTKAKTTDTKAKVTGDAKPKTTDTKAKVAGEPKAKSTPDTKSKSAGDTKKSGENATKGAGTTAGAGTTPKGKVPPNKTQGAAKTTTDKPKVCLSPAPF